jgi:hypothetical protein
VAGSDRREQAEVGRTGARFGNASVRGRDEEDWGETAVSTARTGSGRIGARFGRTAPETPAPQPIPQQVVAPSQPEPQPQEEWLEIDRSHSMVRPYAWTGGRTETAYELPLEALISTNRTTVQRIGPRMTQDHRSVADLCLMARSVAEVAALMSLPLGVARVVLGDMASAGMVVVHRNEATGGEPDMTMLERVLVGLRRL